MKVNATIEPALGALAPRADGKEPARYDLQAGYYFLKLEPKGDAGGVVDVTLGPPGLAAPAPTPPPSRATISFGAQTLEKDGSYLILTNVAPGLAHRPARRRASRRTRQGAIGAMAGGGQGYLRFRRVFPRAAK